MTDNGTTLSDHLPLASIYTAVTIMIGVTTITIVGNSFLLAAICQENRMRRPLYILLANFLVGDILFVSIPVPLNIATFIADGLPFGNVVCHLQAYATYSTISTSACLLTAVAIYRLIQVCYSHLYVHIKSWKWLLGAAVISWATPIVLCAGFGGLAVYQPVKYACNFPDITLTYVLVCCLYIPMIVIVVCCYVKIYLYTRTSRQRVEAITVATVSTAPVNSKPNKRKDEVVFRMVLLIFLEFLFFYVGPGILNSLLNVVADDALYHLTLVAFMLFRIRPAVNFMTYILTNGELRTGLLNVFQCIIKLPNGSASATGETQNSKL